jgi:hypothetical protein
MGYAANLPEDDKSRSERHRVGLCLDCQYARRLDSSRGSTFYRCGLSDTDPSFPKYPRLPILQCPGYARSDLVGRDVSPGE